MPRVIPERSVALEWMTISEARALFYPAADVATEVYMSSTRALLFLFDSGIVRDMLGKVLSIGSVVAAIALVFLLNQTTPNEAGPLGVLIIFLLMYVVALAGVTFAVHGGSRLIAKSSAALTVKRPFRAINLKQSYYYASIIALAPVMLIGMQSVSGVNIYDILLVGFFVVIGVVYISRRMS